MAQNPIGTLQEFLVSRKPVPWPLPSYASSSAGVQLWQAEATLQVPDLSPPLTATEYSSSKKIAKEAAAQRLLEQLDKFGYKTKTYRKQLNELLSYSKLGILVIPTYRSRKVGGGDHAPLWETEVSVTDMSSGSLTSLLRKAVRSTGSKAAAQEAAAKALLEDPELHEVLEDVRKEELAGGNPTLQLQAALSETDDVGPPSKRRRVASEA